MAKECEAKLKVSDLGSIRKRLESLGAANEGGGLERNWVLDRPDGSLRDNSVLLRVRNLGSIDGVLTVKRPVKGGGEFKTREEIECMVDSTDDMLRQLKAIGFRVAWIYEKRRQNWLWRDCVLSLDECPEMGTFIEIEGTPDKIREVAKELGLDVKNHIEDNYLGLWQKHLDSLGQARRDMVFSADG